MITQQELAHILALLPEVNLSDFEKNYCCSLVEYMELKKDDYFLEEGNTVYRIGFVISGSLRKYTYNLEMNRIVNQLIVANCFFTDLHGYYKKLSSRTNIQATTPCHLLTISFSNLKQLSKQNMKFSEFIRQFVDMAVCNRTEIDRLLNEGDATERYHQFNILYPNWDKSFLACDVASRLHMSHANLCLIRNK